MAGPVTQLMSHLLTPGSSMKLLPAVNVCLVCLLGLLIYLADGVLPKVHVYIMGTLATVLLFAVNWFIAEYKKELQRGSLEGIQGDGGVPATLKSD